MKLVIDSFAPPLPTEKLVSYRQIAETADPEIRDWILHLANMVESHQRDEYFDHPDREDCQMIQQLFDQLPSQETALRHAAFHLLWFAIEFANGRQPITTDLL